MWYVIQVMSGTEESTITLIKQRISHEFVFQCFCPMRERKIKYQGSWKLVTEKLFPGYIFIVTDAPNEVFIQLKQIPRLTKLLGDGDNTFIPLNEKEVNFIRRFGDEEHISHVSEVTVEKGNKVVIKSGDLLNYEGEIVKINLHKRIAVVRTEFMGASVDVHMGIEILENV